MLNCFNSNNTVATSARSENYFRFLKENLLEERQPCRFDNFFIKHVRSINTKVIEARAAYDALKKNKIINHNREEKLWKEEQLILQAKENWKNKVVNDTCELYNENEKDNFSTINFTDEYNQLETVNSKDIVHSTPKDISNYKMVDYSIIKKSENNFTIVLDAQEKIIEPIIKVNQNSENDKNLLNKRGMYVTPCPNVKIIHQKPVQKKFKRSFIKNGNRLPPRMINNNKVYLFNTCPSDSITEIIYAA